MKKLFLLLFRVFLLFVISWVAGKFVPYGGFSPGIGLLQDYKLPQFIYSFANFDGAHYISIAKDGYFTYEQAFFPFYPLMVRYLGLLFDKNYLISGLLVSNISFILGLYYFYRYARLIDRKNSFWTILFIIFFPTAFYFSAVYTESLFFLLLSMSFFYAKNNEFKKASVAAYFAALTRISGVLIFIIIFYEAFLKKIIRSSKKEIKKIAFTRKEIFVKALSVLSPFAGLATYMTYLYIRFGDPLYFLNAQPAFGANRSSQIVFLPQVLYRYIRIFFNSDMSIAYMTAVVEFVFFCSVFTIVCIDLYRKWKVQKYHLIALGIFSMTNLLLPTLTGTFSSIPRYALMSVSIFFFLSSFSPRVKIFLLCFFGFMQILFLSLFLRGYFIG